MSLLINASPSLHCLASTVRNHEISGPASDHCPAAINSPACLRVLPVCQHRSVRYALDIPTYAIKKMSVAAVELSYVPGTTYSYQRKVGGGQTAFFGREVRDRSRSGHVCLIRGKGVFAPNSTAVCDGTSGCNTPTYDTSAEGVRIIINILRVPHTRPSTCDSCLLS